MQSLQEGLHFSDPAVALQDAQRVADHGDLEGVQTGRGGHRRALVELSEPAVELTLMAERQAQPVAGRYAGRFCSGAARHGYGALGEPLGFVRGARERLQPGKPDVCVRELFTRPLRLEHVARSLVLLARALVLRPLPAAASQGQTVPRGGARLPKLLERGDTFAQRAFGGGDVTRLVQRVAEAAGQDGAFADIAGERDRALKEVARLARRQPAQRVLGGIHTGAGGPFAWAGGDEVVGDLRRLAGRGRFEHIRGPAMEQTPPRDEHVLVHGIADE